MPTYTSVPELEKSLTREKLLNKAMSDLTEKGVPARRFQTGVTGTFSGEPFCVYAKFIHYKNDFIAVLATRYKGVETDVDLPSKALGCA